MEDDHDWVAGRLCIECGEFEPSLPLVPVTFEGKQVGTARATWDGKGVQTQITWDDDHLYAERHPLDALEEEL